nr:hypothetical protein [Tanacetum cinerariifolium]
MPNPKDITDPTTAMNMALALMAKAFKLNYSTPTNNNQRLSSNPRNRQIAQPGMNMGQYRRMQMVGGNGENQFRQYAEQNVGNLNTYNAVQNVRNQNGNGNLVAARAEGNAAGQNRTAADLNEIEEVNANCILMANLQQALTSGTQTNKAPVYDSDGSAELFKKVSNQKDNTQDTKFAKQPNVEIPPKIGMFRISPDKISREAKKVPNTVSASSRTKPITVSQPSVITKKDMNSDVNAIFYRSRQH